MSPIFHDPPERSGSREQPRRTPPPAAREPEEGDASDEDQTPPKQDEKAEKTPKKDEEDKEKVGGEEDEKSGHGEADESGKGEKPEAPPKKMDPAKKRRLFVIGGIILVAAAIGVVALYLYERHFESTDDAFIDGHVTPVSPQVAAHVDRLAVDDNQDVKAGQLLVQLDPRDYEARLALARAQLEAAEAREHAAEVGVPKAHADLEAAEADVAVAESEADRAQTDFKRYESAGNAVTKQARDNAHAAALSSQAQLQAARQKGAAAKSNVLTAEADVVQAQAAIDQAKAQVRTAELELSYTTISAPIAGRVTRRSVEVGAYVQPGEALLAIVPRDVWITANFRETQLRHMRVGQAVEVEIDAFPERKLKAHVDGIMRGSGARFSLLPPENATGNYVKVVQRVPVKIVFDDALPTDREVGVGMSVVPTVRVLE